MTLGAPVDYDIYVTGQVVRGKKPTLSGGDVPAKWFRDQTGSKPKPGQPLWASRLSLFERLAAGRTKVVLSIPTRKDGVAEPRESVTVKIRVNGTTFKQTVFVK